jgi:hypothetical protein
VTASARGRVIRPRARDTVNTPFANLNNRLTDAFVVGLESQG